MKVFIWNNWGNIRTTCLRMSIEIRDQQLTFSLKMQLVHDTAVGVSSSDGSRRLVNGMQGTRFRSVRTLLFCHQFNDK